MKRLILFLFRKPWVSRYVWVQNCYRKQKRERDFSELYFLPSIAVKLCNPLTEKDIHVEPYDTPSEKIFFRTP